MIALLCTLACLVSANAQDMLLGSRLNVLGNANQFGYARIVKKLGSLPLNDERDLPVALIFSSDPSVEPGLLGPGWSLPLFDSKIYRSRRGVLVWDSPDEYRRFFVTDSAADVRRGENGYVSQKMDWRAVEDERRGSIRITSVKDAEQVFEYRDDRLKEFCIGAGASTFALEYGGRGELRRVLDRATRRTVMEVAYSGAEVTRITVGNTSTDIEMGDGDWTAPDGKVNYRNYRVSFLLRIGSKADGEYFTYTKDNEHVRVAAKEIRLPVNRLTVEQEDQKSWLSYEAQSGFIVADSGGAYAVENAAYDPFCEKEEGQPRVSPRLVKIERQSSGEAPKQLWSRDWPKGLETYTEPDGKLVRKTWIMAKGPAYGKLRRVEEQVGGGWDMIQTMTYQPDGKLLREIDGVGGFKQYAYGADGSVSEVYKNGELVFDVAFSPGGGKTEWEKTETGFESRTFDLNGNLVEKNSEAGLQYIATYGANGLIEHERDVAKGFTTQYYRNSSSVTKVVTSRLGSYKVISDHEGNLISLNKLKTK
jgi:hypothetical protein